MSSKMTSIVLDQRSQDAIEELRETIGATSKAEVMRRALVLLQEAARTASKGGKVILRESDSRDREILVR
ncbi:MAG TPA: hypothetical protein VIY90_14595 [Steroidobacteraceae bacterium]